MSEIACLNRVFRRSVLAGNRPEAIEIETDARHIDIILDQLNLTNVETVVSLGIRNDSSDLVAKLPPQSFCMKVFTCRKLAATTVLPVRKSRVSSVNRAPLDGTKSIVLDGTLLEYRA